MMRNIALLIGFALMLAGPLLQGLAGKTDPNAYIFAPVLLAGSIPLIAGRAIAPSPKLMALAILICGAVVMGLWYLGTLLVPAAAPLAIPGYLPVAVAVAGAALAAAANLLRTPRE
jgi:hypothetical protein